MDDYVCGKRNINLYIVACSCFIFYKLKCRNPLTFITLHSLSLEENI